MRPTACLAALALLLAASGAARAVPLRGLYEASVPVADQSPGARDGALHRALEVVLFRVTGTRNLPPEAQSGLLSRATALVQGYGYEPSPSGQGLRLRAQFDARAIEGALRSQGLPIWGANRPSHVVWLALRDDGQPRAVLDAAGIAARAATLPAVADARGIPVSFPSQDATDRGLVSFNELWSGNFGGVAGASRRYNTEMILIARAGRESGRWLVRWNLFNAAGGSEDWSTTQDTLEAALAAGVDELADRQALRFATQGGSAQELRLRVAGVDSLDAYGRVLNYVRGLNAVRSAQVEAAAAGALTLRLRVEGDPNALSHAIAAGNVLRQETDDRSGQNYVLVR